MGSSQGMFQDVQHLVALRQQTTELIPVGGYPAGSGSGIMSTSTGQEIVCKVYNDAGEVVTLPHCYDNVMSCRTDPYLKAVGKNCAAADPRFVPTMPPYLDKNGHGKLGPMSQVWFPSEQWPSGTGHEFDGPDGVPHGPQFTGHRSDWT